VSRLLRLGVIASVGFALKADLHASGVPSPYDYFPTKKEADLAFAAIHGNSSDVAKLISEGANPDASSKDRIPILGWAYLAHDKSGFKALLDHHANPEIAITHRNIPPSVLELVIETCPGETYWFEQLYDHGANPNFITDIPMGQTIIYPAIILDRDDLVGILVAHGADVNKRTEILADSPLMASIEGGYRLKSSLILLKAGADWTAKKSNGKSFYGFLFIVGGKLEIDRHPPWTEEWIEIVRWLKAHNAKIPDQLESQFLTLRK